jgi:hypothetical protein
LRTSTPLVGPFGGIDLDGSAARRDAASLSPLVWAAVAGCSEHVRGRGPAFLGDPANGAPIVPETGDVWAPWAYPSGCAYIAVDARGRAVIGRESGARSVWQSATTLSHYDGVVSAATRTGDRLPLVLSESGKSPPLTMVVDCEDVDHVRYGTLTHAPYPASLPWGSYLLDSESWTAAARCLREPGDLCVLRSARGQIEEYPLLKPRELSGYSTYNIAIIAGATQAAAVIELREGGTASSLLVPWGTATQLRPLDNRGFAPEVMLGAKSCRVAVVPPYAGPSDQAAYIAVCVSNGSATNVGGLSTYTSFGWLRLLEQGGIEADQEWHGRGGFGGRLGDESNAPAGGGINTLCGFDADPSRYSSDADRLVDLYDRRNQTVRAVRGETVSWLVRTDGCGQLLATCVRDDRVERGQVATASGPIGLRVDGAELVLVDATRVQRLSCEG